MFIISTLFVVLSQLIDSILPKPSKCRSHEYYDKFIQMCQSCKLCCPPRPINEFCKRCNLNVVCLSDVHDPELLNNKNISFDDNIAYAILAFVVFLVVALAVLVSIFTFKTYFKAKNKNTSLLEVESGDTSLKQNLST